MAVYAPQSKDLNKVRILALGLALAFLGQAAPGFCDTPNLSPAWSRQSLGEWKPNISILSKTEVRREATFTDGLLDPGSIPRIRQDYEFLTRDYEVRKNAGLVDPIDQSAQISRMADFSKMVAGEVRRIESNKVIQTAKTVAKKDENIEKPLAVAVGIAAVTTGAPIDAKLGSDTQLRAAANIPYQVGYAQISSPYGNGAITVAGDSGAGTPMTLAPPDWITRTEHYQFSFSRPLPVWELGSGFAYGGTSNTVTASVTKTLRPNLVASLNSVHPVDVDTSTIKSPEQTLSFSYQLHF